LQQELTSGTADNNNRGNKKKVVEKESRSFDAEIKQVVNYYEEIFK
jgi:hypothetical protein